MLRWRVISCYPFFSFFFFFFFLVFLFPPCDRVRGFVDRGFCEALGAAVIPALSKLAGTTVAQAMNSVQGCSARPRNDLFIRSIQD